MDGDLRGDEPEDVWDNWEHRDDEGPYRVKWHPVSVIQAALNGYHRDGHEVVSMVPRVKDITHETPDGSIVDGPLEGVLIVIKLNRDREP